MRRVREILRLKHECGVTDREIARSLSVAQHYRGDAGAGRAEPRLAISGDAGRPRAQVDAVCRPRPSAGRASQGGARSNRWPRPKRWPHAMRQDVEDGGI